MDFKQSVKNGTFFSFVPHRLEIEGMPDLGNFPFNVLFASFTIKDESRIMGSAVYEPDITSFKKDGSKSSMKYKNAYGGNSWLIISFDENEKIYKGEKFVEEKSAGMAFGAEWKIFFVHFTALGLTNGERCLFQDGETR